MIRKVASLVTLILTIAVIGACGSGDTPKTTPDTTSPSAPDAFNPQRDTSDFEIEEVTSNNKTLFIWHDLPRLYTELGHGDFQLIDVDNTICLRDMELHRNFGLLVPQGSYFHDGTLILSDKARLKVGEVLDEEVITTSEPVISHPSKRLSDTIDSISSKCKQDSIRIMLAQTAP